MAGTLPCAQRQSHRPGAWLVSSSFYQRQRGHRVQAETGKTPDETPAGVSALAPARQPVSSKFIRREGARASDDDHAKVIVQRFSILRTRLLREMRDRGWR